MTRGICTKCANEGKIVKAYSKNKYLCRRHHAEYIRNWRHATGRNRPMADAPDSASYLGIVIAEKVVQALMPGAVKHMPNNNPGYDFICGRGYKVDVKSAALVASGPRSKYWVFHPNYNTIADYFVLLAFDTRDKLNPQYVWVVPGHVINRQRSLSITPGGGNEKLFKPYLHDPSAIIACCNTMKGIE